MKRRKGIRWDYNGDGVFKKERLTGFWKRYWRRWVCRSDRAIEQSWPDAATDEHGVNISQVDESVSS